MVGIFSEFSFSFSRLGGFLGILMSKMAESEANIHVLGKLVFSFHKFAAEMHNGFRFWLQPLQGFAANSFPWEHLTGETCIDFGFILWQEYFR